MQITFPALLSDAMVAIPLLISTIVNSFPMLGNSSLICWYLYQAYGDPVIWGPDGRRRKYDQTARLLKCGPRGAAAIAQLGLGDPPGRSGVGNARAGV
jgi:hypothetical protein